MVYPGCMRGSGEESGEEKEDAERLEPDEGSKLDAHVSDHYETLREIARQAVGGHARDGLLNPTELVHEGYVRLARLGTETPERRTEFLALASTVLRNVLVDQARERAALKRGGHMVRLTLEGQVLTDGPQIDLLELDDALHKLARLDERQARIVELKFFGGMTNEEAARVIGNSSRTLESEWKLARAWLRRELGLRKDA